MYQHSIKASQSFGHITTSVLYKKSSILSHFQFLNIKKAKDSFINYLHNASVMAVYDHLKNVMITTLEKDYLKKTQAKKKYTILMNNDKKWLKVMKKIKQCAVYLKDTEHEVDINNLNESSEEEKRSDFFDCKANYC